MGENQIPLYKKILNYYKNMILSGEMKPDTRLPSENVILQDFKVSRITVSRALKELELSGLIYRIKGSGSYVADRNHQLSKSTGPDFISLILPNKGDFSTEILKGIEEQARENGYFVTFHNSSESAALEKELVLEIMSKGSRGFIIYTIDPKLNMDLYSKLMISGFPFVLLDRKIAGLETSLVRVDNEKATYDLTSHLFKQGHTRIVFISNAINDISSEGERYRGFCKAHIDHGIPLLKKNLYGANEDIQKIPDDYMPDTEYYRKACNYLYDILEKTANTERPTAIMAVNDQLASLLIYTAIERGISIPGTYAITGFDNLPYTEHLPIPLTTAIQPAGKIGSLAALELFNRIASRKNKPNEVVVGTQIVIRESTTSINTN